MEYIAYLLIGLGVGYLVALGATGGPSKSERAREELEFAKEKLKMFGAKNVRRN
jgi:hypothetical protein